MYSAINYQTVSRNYDGGNQVNSNSMVQQSVDVGCILSNCGLGAIGCVAKCLTSPVCYIECIGSAAPQCMSCFT